VRGLRLGSLERDPVRENNTGVVARGQGHENGAIVMNRTIGEMIGTGIVIETATGIEIGMVGETIDIGAER